MTESDIYRPPCGSYIQNMNNSFFDNVRDQEGFCTSADVCYPLSTMEDSSFSTPYLETMFHDGYMVDFHDHLDDMDITTENISEYLKDPILNCEISTDVSVLSLEESKGGFRSDHQQSPVKGEADQLSSNLSMISSDTSLDVTSSVPPSLVLPTESMEIDNELGVFHLLMAYAEAMEMGQEELAEVIVKRISEKVSPVGDTLERLIYYMFQTLDKQSDYLKQESLKNFYQAFKAFYQIFPNGKFAHFVANLAILEALPNDASIIRIFDFDIGEGIQWASLVGAIGQQGREVILTSVKFSDEESDSSPLMWRFEDTKKRLCDYARPYGLKLKVEEIELGDLASEIKNIQEGQGRREWFVFNCMIGLLHMGRIRSRKDALEFLESAQNCLQNGHGPDRGIITFGDGDAWEKFRNASNYGSFLDGNMAYYQALLESIKLNFPVHLGDARTAMECLFVAPFVSSFTWAKQWEEKKKYGNLELRLSLEGWKLSQDSLMEAKEVVREGESLYGVRIEGVSNNEMVMNWRGIPMVKVSCWRR